MPQVYIGSVWEHVLIPRLLLKALFWNGGRRSIPKMHVFKAFHFTPPRFLVLTKGKSKKL